MAEAFGAAGSAVGIVSLGIQLSKGLIIYYTHFKAFSTEIDDIIRRSESLQGLLGTLEGALDKAGDGGISTKLKDAITACETGLENIKAAVEKYGDSDVPASRVDRLRAFQKRTLYPLKRGTLVDLNTTLQGLLDILQLAVSTLNL